MVKYHFALLLWKLLLFQNWISTIFMKMENAFGHLSFLRSGWHGFLLNKQSSQASCFTDFLWAHPGRSRAQSNDPPDSRSIPMTSFSKDAECIYGSGGEGIWNVGSGPLWGISVGLEHGCGWVQSSLWDPHNNSQNSPLISGKWSCTWSLWCLLTSQDACACPLACMMCPGAQPAL